MLRATLGVLVMLPTVALCVVAALLTGLVVAIAAAGTWAWRTLSPAAHRLLRRDARDLRGLRAPGASTVGRVATRAPRRTGDASIP